MSGATTRQLILEAAVASIEKYGLEKATTRRIAKEAGTNLASINYHFRTKDDLIAEALSMTIQHMLEDVHAAIAAPDRPLAATIEDVFYYLIEGAGRFPGVTTAHLHVVLVRKQYDSAAGEAIRGVFWRLLERAVDEYPDDDPDELGFSLAQVSSALLLTMLAPGYLPIADRYRPTSEQGCRALARRHAAMLFAGWGKVV